MTVEHGVRVMAGTFVLLSPALNFVSRWWLVFAAFVGVQPVLPGGNNPEEAGVAAHRRAGRATE